MLLKSVLVLALISLPGMVFADGQNSSPLQLVISAPDRPVEGGTLQITATLTNISDHNVVATQIRGNPTIAYRFTVRDVQHIGIVQRKPDVLDESHPLARFTASSITLKPGEQIQEIIELDKLLDLPQSSSYAIRAERYIPAELGPSYLISNEIKVDIRTGHSILKELEEPQPQTKYDVYVE